jgi:hypothetical protein
MVRETIVPQHWYNPDIYDFFIDYFDNECSPNTHARITLTTLDKLATICECELGEVFDNLTPEDAIKLIQSRNLSPWIILLSLKFKTFLMNDVSTTQRALIENVIRMNRWKRIMEQKRNFIPEIKEYIRQVGL